MTQERDEERISCATMDADKEPAGRALDTLIAEKVMGWTEIALCHAPDARLYGIPPDGAPERILVHTAGLKHRIPEYSSDIAAAWEVLVVIGERDWGRVEISRTKLPPTGHYQCTIYWGEDNVVMAFAVTVSLAICRAALKAVGAS